METDFWLRQPKGYILEALNEGFTQFTWHVAALLTSRIEVLSWLRAASLGYGQDIKLMLIDHSGAAEYSIFNGYNAPLAVYPTWASDEPMEQLIWLIENPVGQNEQFCNDKGIQSDMRPVLGQKHRVVIHRLPPAGIEQDVLIMQLSELQRIYSDVDLFISGPRQFSVLFGMNFKSVDWMPLCMTSTGAINKMLVLPTGKVVHQDSIYDPRYKDWVELLGWSQKDFVTNRDILSYNLRAAKWAHRNWNSVKPFVRNRNGRYAVLPDGFHQVSDKSFVLPAARRRVMRNLGFDITELDKFYCDTCILHNACTLYRQGSVCTVKGSETVSLANNFGTRNADSIINGLSALMKRQVERLEDAQAAEDAAGEIDPELTKLYNSVFANGVKLAKLVDPNLSGGAKVQVNVGVGAAAQSVSTGDPRQMVAGVVAALEAQGIPRNEITPEMIKAVLESAAVNGQIPALMAAKVQHEDNKIIQGRII